MPAVYSAVKAVIEHNGKYLILYQQLKGEKILDLPGGKVEYGESPYHTLIREVKEEVALEIEIIRPLGMWWFFRHSDQAQVVCNTFLCHTDQTEIDLTHNPADEAIVDYAWVTKAEITGLDNWPHESLQQLLQQL